MKYLGIVAALVIMLVGCQQAADTGGSTGLQEVDSSMLKAIGYDAASQTLTVKFTTSEEVYTYQGVGQDVYDALISSDSKGTYFTENVKGKFEYTKTGGE